MKRKGFTLIELLIVVAIIAILAAIAVPNFLEAQTRSKVSRTKADMRTMATALEAYYVDNDAFPQCHVWGLPLAPTPADAGAPGVGIHVLERLSTPVAFLTNALVKDVFDIRGRCSASTADALSVDDPTLVYPNTDAIARYNSYVYQAWCDNGRAQTTTDSYSPVRLAARSWLLHSAGPDGMYHNLGGVIANDREIDGPIKLMYDSTNGTVSFGSIYRAGGAITGSDTYAGGRGIVMAAQKAQ